MPSTVEQLSPSRVKLTIEIPFADLKSHLDKAYREIAQQVNIPGFRKGKVPAAIIDQRFGRGMVLQEAINAALPDAYAAAVEDQGIVPLSEPEVDVTKLEDGDLVEFTAELDVRPDFELPDFSTLTATVPNLAETGSEVDERIDVMRQRFATRTDVDRAAASGDVVTLDLEATKDGEALEDATASGITYKIGSGGFLDGLDEAVTGLTAGDETTFSSELVGGPNAGETADIKVVVSKVQEETLPEVDDEFAQMISEFDTVEEMKADLASAVERQARVEQVNNARDGVVEDLVAKTDFEVPERLAAEQFASRKQQITDQLARAGFTLERYLEEADDEEAKTPEEFWADMETRTRSGLKAQIILDKLADDRELGVDQTELTEMLFRRAAASGTSPEQEMQHMMEHGHANEWMQEIRRDKALRLIVAEAVVTDADGNRVNVAAVRSDGTVDESVEAPAPAPAKKPAAKKAPAAKTKAKAEAEADSDALAEKTPAKKPAARKAPAKKAAEKASEEAPAAE